MKTKTFGDVTVDAVLEHCGPFMSPLEMYPDATPEMVAHHRPWLDADGLYDAGTETCILSFHSFLIRTRHHTILIDTCVGEDKERPNRPNWHRQKWPWMDNLKAHGVQPEEIDFVMCTHLHPDHVGWNTQLRDGSWVPTFPNAKYLFAKSEYEYWSSQPKEGNPRWFAFADSVLPIMEAKKAVLVDHDHEIESGLWLEPTPGHTPGHVALNLESGGQRALFTGDMMHHALQVPECQWSSIFCSDGDQSRETRTRVLERCADSDVIVMPQHFPNETAGRVVDRGGKMMFDFLKE